jgi:hypothetical protein
MVLQKSYIFIKLAKASRLTIDLNLITCLAMASELVKLPLFKLNYVLATGKEWVRNLLFSIVAQGLVVDLDL